MTALKLDSADVVKNIDYIAHYREIRARLSPTKRPTVAVRGVSLPAHLRNYTRDPLDDYREKDLSFDLGRRGAFPPPHRGRSPSIAEIVHRVASAHQIRVLDIKSKRRTADVTLARQEAMWLCRKYTMRSLPEIGRAIGGRDHTTVMHACRKIEGLIAIGEYQPLAERSVHEFAEELIRANGGHL